MGGTICGNSWHFTLFVSSTSSSAACPACDDTWKFSLGDEKTIVASEKIKEKSPAALYAEDQERKRAADESEIASLKARAEALEKELAKWKRGELVFVHPDDPDECGGIRPGCGLDTQREGEIKIERDEARQQLSEAQAAVGVLIKKVPEDIRPDVFAHMPSSVTADLKRREALEKVAEAAKHVSAPAMLPSEWWTRLVDALSALSATESATGEKRDEGKGK